MDIADLRAMGVRCNVHHDMEQMQTIVTIPFGNTELSAVADCHYNDIYNKKHGRLIAIARLLDETLGGERVKNTVAEIEKSKADAKLAAKEKRIRCMINNLMKYHNVSKEKAAEIIIERKRKAALDKAIVAIESQNVTYKGDVLTTLGKM